MGKTKTKFIGDNLDEPKAGVEEISVQEKRQKRGPRVRGKRYGELAMKVDRSKLYSLADAVPLVLELANTKFKESIELHLSIKKLGFSSKIDLPHSTGSSKKIEIANEGTVKKLEEGKIDFDILLATADMMPKLVPFAKILGPKGMMPNPKKGTLIKSEEDASKFNANSTEIKTEKKFPLVHVVIGKSDMKQADIIENIEAVVKTFGPRQVKKAHLSSSMGPSVKVLLE